MERKTRVLVHQGGGVSAPVDLAPLEDLDRELERGAADLVLLSELALSPYFAVSAAPVVGGAVRVEGPEVGEAVRVAKRHDVLVALPFAEAAPASGERCFNSIALVGPDGVCDGRYVSGPAAGSAAPTYRKVHLSDNRSGAVGVREPLHFGPGSGFVVWDTPLGRVAPLICYDRSFPESWRAVADAGAEVVVVPIATSRPERLRMLEAELAVAAMQNGVFVVAACKGGTERLGTTEVTYSGGSMVIGPDGIVRARAETAVGNVFLRAELDPADLTAYEATFHYQRDRRPDAYRTVDPDGTRMEEQR